MREEGDGASVAGLAGVGVKQFVERFAARHRQQQRDNGDEQNGNHRSAALVKMTRNFLHSVGTIIETAVGGKNYFGSPAKNLVGICR